MKLHNKQKMILKLWVKWATKTCNLFCNIAAEHVEKQCCVFYHPCSNLSGNKINKVVASCVNSNF